MASHGKSRHVKRLGAAKVLRIPRKNHIWIKTTNAGAHSKDVAIPLIVFLREFLKVCRTKKEGKRLITAKQILVDGKLVTDLNYQVGLMDVVTLKGLGSYIILIKNGVFVYLPVKDTSYKLCKITGKHMIKGGKVQLSFHDGKTLLVDKGEKYTTGDTVKLSIPKLSISNHLKLEKGSNCYVFKGRHAGATGSLIDIHVYQGVTPSNARILGNDKQEIVTLKDYVFVVDKDFKV